MTYAEVPRFSHHEHQLKLLHRQTHYECDGCREPGFGSRYRCELCKFDLHKDCKLSTPSTFHAFYSNCTFKFFQYPPGKRERCCDACGRCIKGYVYHCETGRNFNTCCEGHDLHPCCRNLPSKIEVNGVKCYLDEKVSSKCVWCGKKKLGNRVPGWSYVSTSKEYHFHVSCVKDMLVKNWEKSPGNGLISKNSLALEKTIPNFQLSVQANSNTNGGKINKYWRIAKPALKVIVGTLLGDPTAAVATLIEYLVVS